MATEGSPKEAEAAQALFCAIADYVGENKIDKFFKAETYSEFSEKHRKTIDASFKHIKTTGVTLPSIEKFLRDDEKKDGDWFKSSVNIATKLIKDLKKIDDDFGKIQGPGWADIFYYRGGAGGDEVMENIEELFKVANKNEKSFGDINKWSPADIYFASDAAKKRIQSQVDINKKQPKTFSFLIFNQILNSLIESGDLLGVSLKKAPDEVKIYRINFTEEENNELLENVKYFDISDNRGTDRDVQIYFGSLSKSKPLFKIRHDPHSDSLSALSTIKCEIEGKHSRLGSIVGFGTGNPSGTGITDLWARVDPVFAKKLSKSFEEGVKNYTSGIADLNVKYAKLANTKETGKNLAKILNTKKATEALLEKIIASRGVFEIGKKRNLNFAQAKLLKPTLYDAYKNERILLSVNTIVASFEELMRKYFNEGKKVKNITENASKNDLALQIKKNSVLLQLYTYASAMSPTSGRYVITK